MLSTLLLVFFTIFARYGDFYLHISPFYADDLQKKIGLTFNCYFNDTLQVVHHYEGIGLCQTRCRPSKGRRCIPDVVILSNSFLGVRTDRQTGFWNPHIETCRHTKNFNSKLKIRRSLY